MVKHWYYWNMVLIVDCNLTNSPSVRAYTAITFNNSSWNKIVNAVYTNLNPCWHNLPPAGAREIVITPDCNWFIEFHRDFKRFVYAKRGSFSMVLSILECCKWWWCQPQSPPPSAYSKQRRWDHYLVCIEILVWVSIYYYIKTYHTVSFQLVY